MTPGRGETAHLPARSPKDLMVLSALLATGRLDAGTVRERLRQKPMREALTVRTHDGLARAERMAAEGGRSPAVGGKIP